MEKKKEFRQACHGEWVEDAEGKEVYRADTEKVKEILDQVKPEQLLELLLWEDRWHHMTGLDWCLIHKDEECIRTVVKHVLDTKYVETLTVVFPYAASVKSTGLVSEILKIVPNTRELLKAKTNKRKQTALEFCAVNNHLECIRTIAEHIMKKESDPASLSIVFPYTGFITSTNITRRILDKFQEQCDTLLKSLDFKDGTVLHAACHSGNKEAVEALLPELKNKDILKTELLKHDKRGRTPLCLAETEQKQQWNKYKKKWEVVESDEEYEKRQETATAMLEWIETNAHDILEEVKTR